ncbi:helix-turn-helix domain-containing protein [uncultured Maritimibacter sp.]|jgi:transcriptional regulator with XRE-family HTH domain|uniref:helix-turn-helix domain-containing protein n=1 Tax=uncultured Maritimibacter sp. TaxID=991866 RepID=UPI00263A026B|nr:helix-turn-helix transcriptional regulator [uncultured Maritimibacter sp.]
MSSLRLRELRKHRGLTGEQLGQMLGISKGYISELENGRKTPGGRLLLDMAEVFGVEVADLFDGTPDEKTDASLAAHLEIMRQLPEPDRLAIEKAALGLLAKNSES